MPRRLSQGVVSFLGLLPIALLAQEPAEPQAPFRAEANLIRMDVSVLDKDRRPVRGLTAADFSVVEDGKPQRIVAVSEIDAAEVDSPLSARMRYVPHDISSNDLADEVADGRLFAVLIDDRNLPSYENEVTMNVRDIAQNVIDRLGPSDEAAILYAIDAGRSQDFTSDRRKLIAAIDAFQPHEADPVLRTPLGSQPVQGDVKQFAPANADSRCYRLQPAVPAFWTLTSRMASIRQQKRKTIIYIGMGVPMSFDPRAACFSLALAMRDVFRVAQRSNIVVHLVNPVGAVTTNVDVRESMQLHRPYTPGRPPNPGDPTQMGSPNREFMQIVAENTGGQAALTPDSLGTAISTVFEENAAYYLIGYQTSNGRPDGKFRKVQIKVRRPGTTAKTRSGYWAPGTESIGNDENTAPTSLDLGLRGLESPVGLSLRASALPIARAQDGSADTEVAIALSPRLPALRGLSSDTLTIVRNVYDADGRAGPPVREIHEVGLPRATEDEIRYEVLTHLRLAPGRYQLRLNAQSKATTTGASIYVDVEVPDFAKSALSMSALVLGTPVEAGETRTDALRDLVPILPTTAREFDPSGKVAIFLRVFQAAPAAPVALNVKILNADDATQLDVNDTLPEKAFIASGSAEYQLELPVAKLSRGPYILSATASLPNERNIRRDVVFRIR
jgi:VWFA-related protein